MLKQMGVSSFVGIGIGLMVFGIISIVVDVANGGVFQYGDYQITKMILGSVGVGLGFGLPAVVYESEKIPYIMQGIIHLGIGCAVLIVIAFLVGWIPVSAGPVVIAAAVMVEIVMAVLLWKLVSLYYKKEAEKINKKLASSGETK